MLPVPTLQTEQLLLRPQIAADWDQYRDLMQSDRARFMGGPFSLREAWGLFCHDLAQWQLFGHGALMVECRDSGRCFGQVSINAGPLFPERELGWLLYPEAEGQGYAYEAALALRNWAFGTAGFSTLVSYVSPDNARSQRLAERLGAVLDPRAAPQDPGDLVYRHSR